MEFQVFQNQKHNQKKHNLKTYKRRYASLLQKGFDWDDQQGLSHPVALFEPRLACFFRLSKNKDLTFFMRKI